MSSQVSEAPEAAAAERGEALRAGVSEPETQAAKSSAPAARVGAEVTSTPPLVGSVQKTEATEDAITGDEHAWDVSSSDVSGEASEPAADLPPDETPMPVAAEARSPRAPAAAVVRAMMRPRGAEESPKPAEVTPSPTGASAARRESDDAEPTSKRGVRGSQKLGGIFAVPARMEEPAGGVDLDIDDNLPTRQMKPLVPAKGARPAPPIPELRRVVLDLNSTAGDAPPSSEALPSAGLFSPVLITQLQIAARPSLPPEVKLEHKRKETRRGLVVATLVAGSGILLAALFVVIRMSGTGQASGAKSRSIAPDTAVASTPEQARQEEAPRQIPVVAAQAPGAETAAERSSAVETPKSAPSASVVNVAATDKPAPAAVAPTAEARSSPEGTAAGGPASPAVAKKVSATGGGEPAAPAEPPPKPVETKEKEPPAPPPRPAEADIPFDKSAAAASIAARKALAAGCKQEGGPTGHAKVSITFAPSGRVTTASIDGPPFGGTPVGGCIASKLRGATVPPFSGNPVTVHASVAIF